MKLPQNISPIDLFISSSMSEEDPTALELRNMLRVLGARYDLFNYTFIDDRASPGGPNNEMDRRIQVCDAVIMIIHDHDGEEVRKGILKEYGLAVEYSKPLFMFTHVNFRATDHRRALIDQMRNKKALYEAQFSSNINLVDKLEFTLFDYMMQVLRQELIKSGRDAEDKLSSYELTSEIPGVRS